MLLQTTKLRYRLCQITNIKHNYRSVVTNNPTATAWIGGDFNLPDISWETNLIIGNNNTRAMNDTFLDTLQDLNLSQLVNFPTRRSNTLDLFPSNRPTLINRVEPLPGISDHDTMVFVDTSIKSMRQRPTRRKILLWKHVDYDMLNLRHK